MGPCDRGAQRLVPFGTAATWPCQESEPVVEPAQQLAWRHRTHMGSGELDGQR